MRSRYIVAGLCLVLTLAVGQAFAQPIRVVEIGDSITQGRGSEPQTQSWRYPFWKMLVDYQLVHTDFEFDMIGSLDTGFSGDPDWPDYQGIPFDRDHEGHWGWKSWDILGYLPTWLSAYDAPPDVAMFMLGTNGSGDADAVEHNVQSHREMFELVRDENPNVIILFGLPYQEWDPFPEMREAFEDLAAEMTTAQSPIITVDHSPGWTSNPYVSGTDTLDWVHPNPQGELKVALNWYAAFEEHVLPEPGTLALLGLGALAAVTRRRRRP